MGRVIAIGIINTDMKFKNGKKVCMIEETKERFFGGTKTELLTEDNGGVKIPKFFTKKEAKKYQDSYRTPPLTTSSYDHM